MSLTSTATSSVARCFHRPRVLDRLLLLPSECWEERRQVVSRFHQLNSQRRNTIGDNFSDGTSTRGACHPEVKSCFGSCQLGKGMAGRLSQFLRSFFCKGPRSPACCMRIAAVG